MESYHEGGVFFEDSSTHLGDDVEALKRDLCKTQAMNFELRSENFQLQRHVQDLEAKLHDVHKESRLQVDDLTNTLDLTTDQINILETSYNKTVVEKIESDSQLKHTERQLSELRVSLERTEAENDELERKLEGAQNQIQKVEDHLKMATETKGHLTNELDQTEEKVHILKQEVSLLQKIGLERQKNLNWCEREVHSKQSVASELIENSSDLRRKNDELNKEIKALQRAVEEFQKEHITLQEEFYQTQHVLDEVQSEYKLVADERAALNEELHLFYQKHREIQVVCQLCVYEKHEKEQEITLLKRYVEKIEQELYEMTKERCSVSPAEGNSVSCRETAGLDEDLSGQTSKYQRLDDEGVILGQLNAMTHEKLSLPELMSPNVNEEEVDFATTLESHKFQELDESEHSNNVLSLKTKVDQMSKPTRWALDRIELEEMLVPFQRGWTEAIKLKSVREEQLKELLNTVARLKLEITSLKNQNNQLMETLAAADSRTESVRNDVKLETSPKDKKAGLSSLRISSLENSMTKGELIQIIQKLDSELEEAKEDLLTARVFNDSFVEYKIKLCRKFRKEQGKIYDLEKELCRFRAEKLRLNTDITLYRSRLNSVSAQLSSSLLERDRYKQELDTVKKNMNNNRADLLTTF